MNITIIDYGVGNIRSITNMLNQFKKLNIQVTNDPDLIFKSDKLILPGVGAFGLAMSKINNLNIDASIKDYVKKGNSILGICLGMQLLMDSSDELGKNKGLSLIPGNVKKIPNEVCNILPNIGYYKLNVLNKNFKYPDGWFYFVHSYHCLPNSTKHIASNVNINSNLIVSSVIKDNIHGCQFHPERSADAGLDFFKLFLNE